MSAIMQVTSLKDIKPFKNGWKVHVKVLHTWKQYSPLHDDTLAIVLSLARRLIWRVKDAFFLLEHGGGFRISASVVLLECFISFPYHPVPNTALFLNMQMHHLFCTVNLLNTLAHILHHFPTVIT